MKKLIMNKVMYAAGEGALSTGVSELDQGLKILKDLTVGIIAGIGVVILAWGIFELASAMNQHDSAQYPNAFRRIAAGVLMMAIGTVIGLFI